MRRLSSARHPLFISMFFIMLVYSSSSYLFPLRIFATSDVLMVGFAIAIPILLQTVIATPIGFLLETSPPRGLLIGSCSGMALGLALGLFGTSTMLISVAFVIIAVSAASFGNLVNALVPRLFTDLQAANSSMSVVGVTASILGPLGMVSLQSTFSYSTTLILLLGCLGMGLIVALLVAVNRPVEIDADSRLNFRRIVVLFIGNRELVSISASLGVVFLGLGCTGALEVPFIVHILHAGATGYGIMLSWSSVAMLVGSLVYNRVGSRLPTKRAYVLGAIGMAVAWAAYALSPNYPFAVAMVLIAALFNSLLTISGLSLIQELAGGTYQASLITLGVGVHQVTGAVSLVLWSGVAMAIGVRTALLGGAVVAICSVIPILPVIRSTKISGIANVR
jgi:MFS family permease